jgi:hypothetical protein
MKGLLLSYPFRERVEMKNPFPDPIRYQLSRFLIRLLKPIAADGFSVTCAFR